MHKLLESTEFSIERQFRCFSSMFILTNSNSSEFSFATFSIIGVNCLQGPHQGAQKSTTINLFSLAFITFLSKSP